MRAPPERIGAHTCPVPHLPGFYRILTIVTVQVMLHERLCTMNDRFACLGLGLQATDEDVHSAYQRATTFLEPDRLSADSLAFLRVNRLLADHVRPAYAILRTVELRRSYLQSHRAAVSAARPAPNHPREESLRRLTTAHSDERFKAVYEEEVRRLAALLFVDVQRYREVVAQLSDLNVAYILRGQDSTRSPQTVALEPASLLPRQHPQMMTAQTLLASGQPSRALQVLRVLRVPGEQLGDYHRLIAQCYRAMGMATQAFQEFQTALKFDPQCQEAREFVEKHRRLAVAAAPVPKKPQSKVDKVIAWLNKPI